MCEDVILVFWIVYEGDTWNHLFIALHETLGDQIEEKVLEAINAIMDKMKFMKSRRKKNACQGHRLWKIPHGSVS